MASDTWLGTRTRRAGRAPATRTPWPRPGSSFRQQLALLQFIQTGPSILEDLDRALYTGGFRQLCACVGLAEDYL
jgi:hypothetical protein